MERKWWTLVAVAVGTFMLLLDVTIVNVALPDIQQALNASLADLQWVIDAYALTLAAFQLTAGSLADRFGRRRVFAIGIVVFTLGSLLCGVASSSTFLSVSRAHSRASAARSCSPPASRCSRARSTGASAARPSASSARSPASPWPSARWSAARSSRGFSWRWIFFVNLPVGDRRAGHRAAPGRRVA